ncbi:hypothetical protein TKK_0004600 [Trichogramma kaykai]
MSNNQKIIGYTDIDVEYFDFTWVISNYLVLPREENLSGGCNDKKELELKLKNELDVISIFLRCTKVSDNANDFKAGIFNLNLFNNGEIVFTKKNPFLTFCNGEQVNICNIPKLDIRTKCYLFEDLKFGCEFSIFVQDYKISQSDGNDVPKLKFDMVFLDEKFSDLVIQTACGKKVPAHRVILAAASPVFNAMFSHNMLENQSQSVDMVDISYDTAVEMLRYIYTGSVETQECSLVAEVLVAADKYELENLKIECEKLLSSKLSSKNVIDILKVADKCRIKNLKENAVDFLKKYIAKSSDTDDVGNMFLDMEKLFSK